MQINVIDPVFQTYLFTLFLLFFIFLTFKKDKHPGEMNNSHTNELKGVAILSVIFVHVGYFLSSDNRFLYPLSTISGVGVNIFLFLSGFGLTVSSIKSKLSVAQFYKKRLKGIYIPMWLVLSAILLFDFSILHHTYDFRIVIESYLGFFPKADIFSSINSPLWYFSLIVFYYLIFPLIFIRDRWYISAVGVWLLSLILLKQNLPVTVDVLKLYKLHYLAFPLGMLFAGLFIKGIFTKIYIKLSQILSNKVLVILKGLLLILCVYLFGHTALHSGVGTTIRTEQLTSLVTTFCVLVIVLLKYFQSEFLVVLGKYSYIIYLIHWPLMYRFDFIYKYTPAFLGTILYLFVLIFISYLLTKPLDKLLSKQF